MMLLVHPEGKRSIYINTKHIAYVIDCGSFACDVVMSPGGDMNTGLPGALRLDISAPEFIDQLGMKVGLL